MARKRRKEVKYNNNYCNDKNIFFSCGLFLLLMFFITSITVFYISNTIALTELGYKLIELENYKIKLVEENKKLELMVETLSSLDRVEEIACNHLGMIRPKEVNFIASLPASKINPGGNIEVISNNYEGEKYFWASFDLKKVNELILSVLK
ncbi:MAG TPA: hypothetical protein DEG96_07380 [Candidatus Atribacteria bacterium]|nr:hypothetical protein [Candidatus Atribacteria bacterium]